jgi:hypothetical protein
MINNALWLAKMSSQARSLRISDIQFEAKSRDVKEDRACNIVIWVLQERDGPDDVFGTDSGSISPVSVNHPSTATVCSETSSNSRRSNAPMGTFLSKARLR